MTITEAHTLMNRSRDTEVLEALQLGMIDVEATDRDGTTLLMLAARHNSLDVIEYLLERVDPSHIRFESNYGQTALHEACRQNNVKAAYLLLSAGADADQTGIDGGGSDFVCSVRDMVSELDPTDRLREIILAQ